MRWASTEELRGGTDNILTARPAQVRHRSPRDSAPSFRSLLKRYLWERTFLTTFLYTNKIASLAPFPTCLLCSFFLPFPTSLHLSLSSLSPFPPFDSLFLPPSLFPSFLSSLLIFLPFSFSFLPHFMFACLFSLFPHCNIWPTGTALCSLFFLQCLTPSRH